MGKVNIRIILSVALIISGLFILSTCQTLAKPSTTKDEGFAWDTDKSKLIGHTICDGKVQLYYSVCFKNHLDVPVTVSTPIFRFSKKDLIGWLKHEEYFVTAEIAGADKVCVPAREEMYVTYVFEGVYLGGEINYNLPFPTFVCILDYD